MVNHINDAIKLSSWLKDRWHKPSTLLLGLLITLIVGILLSFQYDLIGFAESISWQELVTILTIMALLICGWFISTRLPRTPPDKIGILIAIDCETKKERQRLKADFIQTLRDEMTRGNNQQYIVHELSEYHSRMIGSSEDARSLLKQTGSHLVVYGRCKVRVHQSRPTYILEISASCRHAPISQEVSRQFSKDIDLAFPRKTLIPETEELHGFELARDLVGVASRFILGIANLISGNPVSAFDLHYGVWTELRQKEESGLAIQKQLTSRVATVLVVDGINAATLRLSKKPPNYLKDMGTFLDVVQQIDPNHYGAHLLRGIYLFLFSRNIERAKKEIRLAKNSRDAAWLWSSAFLDAYEGKLEQAHKTYQRAFRGLVDNETPLQVETFIVDVLYLEPNKIQLWYCLGMINYFYKEDLPSALKDFQKFLMEAEKASKFGQSVAIAKKLISEIESQLRTSTGAWKPSS